MRRLVQTRTRRALLAVAVLAVAATTVAFAAWLISGNDGDAAGRTAALQAPTLTVGTPNGGDLFPGGTGAAYVRVTNPNNLPLYIQNVQDDGGAGQAGSVNTGAIDCPASNFSLVDRTFAAGSRPIVPPNAAEVPLALPDVIALAANAPSACQGLTVTFTDKLRATYTTEP